MAGKTKSFFGPSWFSLTNVRKQVLFISGYITTILGGWVGCGGDVVGLGYVENKANSVQLQLELSLATMKICLIDNLSLDGYSQMLENLSF